MTHWKLQRCSYVPGKYNCRRFFSWKLGWSPPVANLIKQWFLPKQKSVQRSSCTAAVAMTRCSESKRPRSKQPCDKYAFPWEEDIKPEDRRNRVYLLLCGWPLKPFSSVSWWWFTKGKGLEFGAASRVREYLCLKRGKPPISMTQMSQMLSEKEFSIYPEIIYLAGAIGWPIMCPQIHMLKI